MGVIHNFEAGCHRPSLRRGSLAPEITATISEETVGLIAATTTTAKATKTPESSRGRPEGAPFCFGAIGGDNDDERTAQLTRSSNHKNTLVDDDAESVWHKATASIRLLKEDPKMKYLIFLNAVFGFSAAFLNSFVNGPIVRARTLHAQSAEGKSVYAVVGMLMSVTSATAALCSIFFGSASRRWGKGPVLIVGAVAFFLVPFPFVLQPDVSRWTWSSLAVVYALQGVGRSTFEGTLRGTFADYFPHEKEGAFGNIVFQHGLSSAVGFFLSVRVRCHGGDDSASDAYCVEYADGSWHNVLPLEYMVMATAILAIGGYLGASVLRSQEQKAKAEAVEEQSRMQMSTSSAPRKVQDRRVSWTIP